MEKHDSLEQILPGVELHLVLPRCLTDVETGIAEEVDKKLAFSLLKSLAEIANNCTVGVIRLILFPGFVHLQDEDLKGVLYSCRKQL